MQLDSVNTTQVAPKPVSPSAQPAAAPSIHRRALITWLAIFPLVCLGQLVLSPVADRLPLVVSTLILTVVVVPVAVYIVVPFLLKANARISRRRQASQ